MIGRIKYLNQLISTKNNGFPKVITGICRCGKSYLLKDIYIKYLKEECHVVNKPFKEMRDPEGYVLIGIADFLLNFIK